jgi:hypothetical protein
VVVVAGGAMGVGDGNSGGGGSGDRGEVILLCTQFIAPAKCTKLITH